jgi:hypothetical protein
MPFPLAAAALTAALALAVLADVRRDVRRLLRGRNVVLLGLFAWYLLEALQRPKVLAAFPQAHYHFGLALVALAGVCFLLGYHRTRGCAALGRLGNRVSNLEDRGRLWKLVVVGAAIGFAPILYFTGGDLVEAVRGMLQMRKTWGGVLGRGRYGDARAALLQLEMFVNAVGPFAFLLLLDRRVPWPRRVACAAIAVWPLLRAYGTGTRSALLAAVLPVLVIIYFKARPAVQRRLVVGALLAAPVVYTFMAAMVISRGSGELSWDAARKADYVGNEMFRELLFISDRVPGSAEYQLGYSYYVQLVNPVPRFLWPDKPTLDTGLLMARLYGAYDRRTGEAFLTVSPGILGEMYLNFGVLGIAALSFFGGWLVRGWDLLPERYGGSLVVMIYYVAGLAVLFNTGRSVNMATAYALIAFGVLAALLGKPRQAPAPVPAL